MKVKDIIKEGWGTVASNLAKSVVGLRPDEPWRQTTPQTADEPFASDTKDVAPSGPVENPESGSVVVTTGPGGMEYFKSHTGIWFEKPDSRPDAFSASGALQIKDPVKKAALEKLAHQDSYTVFVKPAGPGDNVNFVTDTARQARAEKLASARSQRRPS